jgi:predicted dehydrogenase
MKKDISFLPKSNKQSRRKFLCNLGLAGLSIPMLSTGMKIIAKEKPKSMFEKNKKDGKLGVALVGLGAYAAGQLAPALLQTEHCYLAGIVTGTPSKAATWKEKYNIPEKNIYNYENYDSIKDNPDIDIIYVVLPNSMHAEYTIRGAKAGKHITCEKPMAITVEDCDKMIAACKKAGKMLSIGYRLHFDPYHLEMVRQGTKKIFGEIKTLSAGFGFKAQKGIWRLDKKLAGGGPLMDLGIYCLQGVCYTTGMEPVAVTAQSAPISDAAKFVDIEETLSFQMEMPNGLKAECKTSYTDGLNYLKAEAADGFFELQPAFNYAGLKGKTTEEIISFAPMSQQAKQMDEFALAIKSKRPTIVPGEMGRRDVKIITAIYEAMHTGKRVVIAKG